MMVAIPDRDIADLRRRLHGDRLPSRVRGYGWDNVWAGCGSQVRMYADMNKVRSRLGAQTSESRGQSRSRSVPSQPEIGVPGWYYDLITMLWLSQKLVER